MNPKHIHKDRFNLINSILTPYYKDIEESSFEKEEEKEVSLFKDDEEHDLHRKMETGCWD